MKKWPKDCLISLEIKRNSDLKRKVNSLCTFIKNKTLSKAQYQAIKLDMAPASCMRLIEVSKKFHAYRRDQITNLELLNSFP